jgi:hypothetical protein
MTWALVAVVVVAATAVFYFVVRWRAAQSRADQEGARADSLAFQLDRVSRDAAEQDQQLRAAHGRVAAAEEQLALSSGHLEGAEERVTQLEQRLGDLEREHGSGRPPSPERATLLALWNLARLEHEWSGRHVAALSTAKDPQRPGDSLAAALDEEIGRIREEIGTPGSLVSSLQLEPDPGSAVLLLCSVQTMLASLARHCQAFDLVVSDDDNRLSATVLCEDFDGPESVADDISALLAVVAPTGGDLDVDRDAQGRVVTRLSFPVPGNR